MIYKKTEEHYFDANGTEINYGDILSFEDLYPFKSDGYINYYGLVMWSDVDNNIVVRTTVGDNERVLGCSDGNCDYIDEYAEVDENNKLVICNATIIGNVKNKEDVNKYLREKKWCIEDCF